jgi:outer membrane lipoprotein-sorting protein
MRFDDSGRMRSVAIVALLLATVAVAAVAGLAFGAMDSGSDDRTGEEILSDVQETYTEADSVSSDAVVTVEIANRTAEFEVSAAAAGADRKRVNVSAGGYYTLTGVDNGTVWRYDSFTGLTGVLDRNGTTVTATLRGGTEAPSLPGLSVLPDDIDPDTELSAVLDSFDGDLPDGVEAELDDLPANVTVGEVLANDSLAGDIDGALPASGNELPDGFEDFEFPDNLSEYELPDGFEDFEFPDNLSEYELPDGFEDFEFPDNLSEYELPADWDEYNETESRQHIEELLTGEFNASAVTVERVGTTTVDGTDANELLVSHPETESETRIWTDAERDTVLRAETTAPGLTVTVDVDETRFDVSPADSTFEPPGATELASLSASTAESPGALGTAAPFDVAVPGEEWRFERGAVLSGDAPALPAIPGVDPTDIAAAVYSGGESTVVVGQTGGAIDLEGIPAFGTEMVTVGDRDVRLLAGEYASVAAFSEAGTTVVVAGDLSGEQLRSVIAGIELQDSGA